MHTLSQIRSSFIDYFRHRDHQEIDSSPLVPLTDASLMFTNSGMVQFKNIFTGAQPASVPRAVTSQKCMRAGGKHNDLENVGHTARHHTFFEMLGNFSFGDYFKEQAISYAWEFLTKDLALSKSRLVATIYHDDDEAEALWRKIAGLSSDRIIRINTSDNFWQMGDTGPCGPCSEIYYDHGPTIAGGLPGTADEDGDRYVEIWNLVFMQYLQDSTGKREKLPKPSIDTGMGLERIAAVLQGKQDNYDIDVMQAIVSEVQDLTGHVSNTNEVTASHKVIADHMRSICFLLAEGVMPTNEGRGYVLRRIMRRAMRHAYLLGMREPVLYRIVHTVTNLMDDHYGELQRAETVVKETLQYEEERFGETLQRGMRTLDTACAKLPEGAQFPAEVAFRLYDTYGFPIDLTEDILKERNFKINRDGVDTLMMVQRQQARKSWKGSGGIESEAVWFELQAKAGNTEFLGYNETSLTGYIQAIVDKKDSSQVSHADLGQQIDIIVNQTPFYAEGGGQIGDRGMIKTQGGVAEVVNTKRYVDGLIVHSAKLSEGNINVGEPATLEVNRELRNAVSRNHTLTHLLHAALRLHLGVHVAQRGSSVSEDGLRFDFSHPRAIATDDLTKIENTINAWIWENTPVEARIMDREQAIQGGAMALFGERYGDEVRVVRVGLEKESPISMELCGGTHVSRTGDIGMASIMNESAVAAGVRRIEMTTGGGLLQSVRDQRKILYGAQTLLRCGPSELLDRIKTLQNARNDLQQESSTLRRQLAARGHDKSTDKKVSDKGARLLGGIQTIVRRLKDFPARELKQLADNLRNQVKSGVIVIGSENDGKVTLLVGVTDDMLEKGLDARTLISAGAEVLGTRAGGRPSLAQTGSRDCSSLPEAIERVVQSIQSSTIS